MSNRPAPKMPKRLSERQRQVLEAALTYAYCNADDLNDCFASFTDGDPDNEAGKVLLAHGVIAGSFDEGEFEALGLLFGIDVRPETDVRPGLEQPS